MPDAMPQAPMPAAPTPAPKGGKGWMIVAILFILLFLISLGAGAWVMMQASADRAMVISLNDELSGRNDEIMALQELLTAAQETPTPEVAPVVDTSTGELLETYLNVQGGGAPIAENVPVGYVNLGAFPYNICPPAADGPCGFSYDVWAEIGWEDADQSAYYVATETGTGTTTYGPFTGDVVQIERDLRLLKGYAETL